MTRTFKAFQWLEESCPSHRQLFAELLAPL
jgi:hypothetical protein